MGAVMENEFLTMLGQVAYEAYCESTGWKSAVSGAPLPGWDTQTEEIKQAWKAAALAVSAQTETRYI